MAALLALVPIVGCQLPSRLHSPKRTAFGRVYVLPGIEGGTIFAGDIARGLEAGGVRSAIELYDWTTGIPGALLINLTDLERNRRVAQDLADDIVAYKTEHPGRPVHLVGHSGGAGLIVLALERLPETTQVDGAILLAPALSPEYDLTRALARVVYQLVNFYSRRDVALLQLGTSVFGQIDRGRGAAAGAIGFDPPPRLAPEDRRLYVTRLRQIAWNERMSKYGASGSHIGWADAEFARKFIAPIIVRHESRVGIVAPPVERDPEAAPPDEAAAPPSPPRAEPSAIPG